MLSGGASVLREDWAAALENHCVSSPLAQQLMKAEQLPTPPPQSASVAQNAMPQLHLQVLRCAAANGSADTGTEKTLLSERSGIK